VGAGADPERGGDRLAGEHVSPVELPGDDALQEDLPVRLGRELHIQALLGEIAFLVSDHQRRAVGQLDEAEFQVALLRGERPGAEGQFGQFRFVDRLLRDGRLRLAPAAGDQQPRQKQQGEADVSADSMAGVHGDLQVRALMSRDPALHERWTAAS